MYIILQKGCENTKEILMIINMKTRFTQVKLKIVKIDNR